MKKILIIIIFVIAIIGGYWLFTGFFESTKTNENIPMMEKIPEKPKSTPNPKPKNMKLEPILI